LTALEQQVADEGETDIETHEEEVELDNTLQRGRSVLLHHHVAQFFTLCFALGLH